MFASTIRGPKGSELVRLDRTSDIALTAYLVHPNYSTNLPPKLHALLFNALDSMVDVNARGLTGWRRYAESTAETRILMGKVARKILGNVNVTSFLSSKVR